MNNDTTTTTRIEADATVPIIRMSREFAATPEQLFRAHTDRELFAQWIGPDGMDVLVDEWDARSGGSFRYHAGRDGESTASTEASTRSARTGSFRRSATTASPTAWPSRRSPSPTWATVGPASRRQSLCDSFEARDAWLASGMEVGVEQGYAKLDRLLEGDAV